MRPVLALVYLPIFGFHQRFCRIVFNFQTNKKFEALVEVLMAVFLCSAVDRADHQAGAVLKKQISNSNLVEANTWAKREALHSIQRESDTRLAMIRYGLK